MSESLRSLDKPHVDHGYVVPISTFSKEFGIREIRHDKDDRNQRGKHNGVSKKRSAVCLSMRHDVAPIDFILSPGIIHGALRPLLHYLYGLALQVSRILRGISTILAGPSNPIRTRYFGRFSHQNLTTISLSGTGIRSAGSAVRGVRFSTGVGE